MLDDIWYYLFISCFDWKIGVFQQTVVRVYYTLKGTLMQIWKSSYMFVLIWKQYPENFAFLIVRIIKLFVLEVYKFLKK